MQQWIDRTERVNHTQKVGFHPFVFTGKERDSETGYGYFGARYMDHEQITMWLSVDPLADKYPGISPYAYCAWNPVKLVDPDGREIGDYYDKNGTYLGWDGKYDDNVYIITNMSDQMMIKENNRKGESTPLSDLSEGPCLATTYTALKASIEVGNRTKDNGGLNEECSLVDGRLIYKGEKGSHSIVHLPIPPYEVSFDDGISVHSHTDDNDATHPGPKDPSVFSHYHQNIIVGPLFVTDKAGLVKGNNNVVKGLAFYPSIIVEGQAPSFTMSYVFANTILSKKPNHFYELIP